MKYIVFAVSLLGVSTFASAQTLTVKKVKGSQAIVEVANGAVNVGEKFDLGGGSGGDDLEMTASSTGPRKRVIGITTGEMFIGKSDTGTASNNSTTFNLNMRYGWNHGVTEWGAIGILGLEDTGGGSNTTFGGGGFFDWNLKLNKPGNDMLFGASAAGTYQITNVPNGGSAINMWQLFPSGFMKWFVLGTPTCIRFDLGYSYAEASQAARKTKTSGFAGALTFGVYF